MKQHQVIKLCPMKFGENMTKENIKYCLEIQGDNCNGCYYHVPRPVVSDDEIRQEQQRLW